MASKPLDIPNLKKGKASDEELFRLIISAIEACENILISVAELQSADTMLGPH
jgi:HKD family nuclease